MFHSQWRRWAPEQSRRSKGWRCAPRIGLELERLEDRCVPAVAVTAAAISTVFEGQLSTGLQVATFTDSNTTLTAGQFNITRDQAMAQIARSNFLKVPATVQDTANAAVLVASDRARMMTGTVLNATAGAALD